MPAHIESGAFDGVDKDNFTLEVPESAISQYPSSTRLERLQANRSSPRARLPSICSLRLEHGA